MTDLYTIAPSPIGDLLLVADGAALTHISMLPWDDGPDPSTMTRDDGDGGVLADAHAQLDAYFAGTLTAFDLPLAPRGSTFQRRVWQALTEIPYGETWSYGELATHVGAPTAARAVGAANGQNPLPVVIPCHRVIGAGGRLVGYGGGLDRKRTLLGLEARVAVERNFGDGRALA
ncbi:MAG: methylated-DNA--[protein]-cysteine S-methyltransferase [Actinomycetes bacterium]